MMLICNVPVQTCENLCICSFCRVVCIRAGIITVVVHQMLLNSFHICLCCTRDIVIRISNTILRSSPKVNLFWALALLEVHEEEQLVLDDRSTESSTVSCNSVLSTITELLTKIIRITSHPLILVVCVSRTLELVCS